MGIHERAAWYSQIDRRTDLPAELRKSMREQVIAFDRLLSEVLGTMELHYLRWRQSSSLPAQEQGIPSRVVRSP